MKLFHQPNNRRKNINEFEKNKILNQFSSGIKIKQSRTPKYGLGSDPTDISYDDSVNQNTGAIVQWALKKMVDYLVAVIQKYDQAEFHRRMAGFYIADEDGVRYPGYDFIKDFRIHHRVKFAAFMKAAKKGRNMIMIDLNTQVNNLIGVLEWNGWMITPIERGAIEILFRRLYNMIYHDIDIKTKKPHPKKSVGERLGFFANDPTRQIKNTFSRKRW